MKKHKTLLLLPLLFILCTSSNGALMSGTYTINPTTPATLTNFHTFYSAIAFLTGGTRNDSGINNTYPFGVSGPVLFTIASGFFLEQVNLTTVIAGTSQLNTITFDGGNGNASTRILSNPVSNSQTISINNNPYISFKNLTIYYAATTSNGTGVQISGASNCCRISKCNINVPTMTGYLSYGIYLGLSRLDSTIIDSNIISGCLRGIYASPVGATSTHYQAKIIYNQLLNFSGQGIYLSNQTGIIILNNTLVPNSASSGSGITCINISMASGNNILLNGNKIYNYLGTGITVTGNNSSNAKGLIMNNMLGGNLRGNNSYGINISGNYWSVINNSINYDTISSGNIYCPIYIQSICSGISILNNICSVRKTNNLALSMYVANATSIDSMDYNAFYRADTSDHLLIYFGTYYNSGNFIGAGGFNLHSVYLNPGFVNDSNLHITLPCLRSNMLLPYVTNDIDGNSRNFPPSIGAHEVTRYTNDMSTLAMLAPAFPINTGAQNLRVRVVNYGNNLVTSFNLSYKLNNNTPVTQSWSGILNPCDTVTLLFTGVQQITIPSGTNVLKIYTTNPNGTTDGNMLNDTLTNNFVTAMGGNYTIGPAPSNYNTIAGAITDLNTYGVGGAVKFLIKTGTYNESLTLTTPTGASFSNPVSFTSVANSRDSVILNANGTYVLNLLGSFFTISNLTLNQQSSTTGVVQLTGTPGADTIYNCKIIAPIPGSSTCNLIYGNGITMSGMVFRKNLFQGGYNGLNVVSSSSSYSSLCIIDSNVFQNTYYAHTLEYFYNLKFRNNTISVNTNNLNILIEYAGLGYEFTNNIINVSSGITATLFLSYYCTGTSGSRLKINNNTFTVASGASINLFAPYYYSSFVDFYNNSLALGNGYLEIGYNSNDIRCYNNSVSSSNTGYSFYHNESGNSNMDVKNNVISNTGGGVALYWNSTPSASVYDYNNLYSTGTNLVSVNSGATNYASLSAWRGAYGMDKNSVSYRPGFTNASNILQPNTSDSACWSLNGRGIPTSWITTDITGSARSAQIYTGATDIGAYEFTPAVSPPMAVASPASPVASSTQYFSFGSDTIASIQWGTSVPSSLQAQLYSGTNPPALTGGNYMKTYWNFTALAGSYNYTLTLNYKDPWLGTNPNETSLRMAKYVTSWSPFTGSSSSVDTVNNIITASGVTGFGSFTGTNNFNPLPVKLMNFNAQLLNENEVQLTWQTSSEIYNDHFEIERAFGDWPLAISQGPTYQPPQGQHVGRQAANSQWLSIGIVKACLSGRQGNGTNNLMNNYQFTDYPSPTANSQSPTAILYYRLKQVDHDAHFEYSPIVTVNTKNNTVSDIVISPNPNNGIFNINKGNTNDATVEIYDLIGNRVYSGALQSISSQIDLSDLIKGIYFIRFSSGDSTSIRKIVIE